MGHKTVETACNISHTFGPTGSDQLGVELRRSSRALPKAKLIPEKMAMVTVWWSAAPLIPYSFLNHGETTTSEKYAQQIDEMRQKLQQLQPALINSMGHVLLHDNAQ